MDELTKLIPSTFWYKICAMFFGLNFDFRAPFFTPFMFRVFVICSFSSSSPTRFMFQTKKLAKKGEKKIKVHMLSAAALLEVSWRMPSLDYITLMQLTMFLTHDFSELEKMYRLMCFNVFAHNQDDHAKNFSYLFRNGKGSFSGNGLLGKDIHVFINGSELNSSAAYINTDTNHKCLLKILVIMKCG